MPGRASSNIRFTTQRSTNTTTIRQHGSIAARKKTRSAACIRPLLCQGLQYTHVIPLKPRLFQTRSYQSDPQAVGAGLRYGHRHIIPGKMKCYLEFITTPSTDLHGTLTFLHFDDRRYLIGNLSEGAQRACTERGVSLRKMSDILVSGRTEWSNIGGMIGAILTLSDIKNSVFEAQKASLAKKIETLQQKYPNHQHVSPDRYKDSYDANRKTRFYGAPNLNFAFACARRFVFRTGTPFEAVEHGHKSSPERGESQGSKFEPWSDDRIQVWPMPIFPSRSADSLTSKSHKRSFDVFSEAASLSPSSDPGDLIKKASTQSKMVVEKMFNSDWKLDRLVEERLRDVQMPAAIFVKESGTGKLMRYEGPMPGGPEPVPDIPVLVRTPWPGATVGPLPSTAPSPVALSYIVKNHPQRGKFLPSKAMQLKVSPKSLWGNLTRGETVKNLDGKEVTPEMVMEPTKEGGGIAFLDIPSLDYVEPLLKRPEWSDESIMEGIGAIVWALGPGVHSSELLQAFQHGLHNVQHIMSSAEMCPDGMQFTAAKSMALRHNRIDSPSFPLPREDPTIHMEPRENQIMARPGLQIHLEPVFKVNTENVAQPIDEAEKLQILDNPEVSNALSSIRKNPIDPNLASRWEQKVPYQDVEVITLGTGSSHPSKTRNVSGTLVRVPGDGSYLLDAGEGTLGTLKRMYSPAELQKVLEDLKMVWISHMHADHHLGLVSVIKAWYEAVHGGVPSTDSLDPHKLNNGERRLAVASDSAMLFYLKEYANMEDYGYSRILPICVRPAKSHDLENTRLSLPSSQNGQNSPDIEAEALELLNLSQLSSVYVAHCKGAQAVSITTKRGFKFSYSGDCRPSGPFVVIGRDSHLLIHEATFEDALRGEALAKKHSTAGEALLIAGNMRARSVVLTHFSQRYPKMSVLGALSEEDGQAVASESAEGGSGRTKSPRRSEGASRDPVSAAASEEKTITNSLAQSSSTADHDPEQEDEGPLDHPERAPRPATPPSPGRRFVSLQQAQPHNNGSGNGGRRQEQTHRSRSRSPGKSQETRFSGEAPTEAEIRALIHKHDMRVVMAFDYMKLRLANMPHLERLQPVLRLVYDKLAGEDDLGEEEESGDEEQTEEGKAAEKGKAQKGQQQKQDAQKGQKRQQKDDARSTQAKGQKKQKDKKAKQQPA